MWYRDTYRGIAGIAQHYSQLDHDTAIRFLASVQLMREVVIGVDNVFTTLFGCHGNDP